MTGRQRQLVDGLAITALGSVGGSGSGGVERGQLGAVASGWSRIRRHFVVDGLRGSHELCRES